METVMPKNELACWLATIGYLSLLGSMFLWSLMVHKPWAAERPTRNDIGASQWKWVLLAVPIGVAMIYAAYVVEKSAN